MLESSSALLSPRNERSGDASVNGLRLRYWIGGQGPPLVLLHGAGGNLQMSLSPPCGFRALSDEFTLVAYDQRGCGDSERVPLRAGVPSRASLHIDRHVEDLAAFVDLLGLRRFSLCGVSFSGAIALRYALRFPERLDHLVCVSGGVIPMGHELAVTRVRDRDRYQRRVTELGENLRRWDQFTIDAFYQFEIARHICAALVNPKRYDDMMTFGTAGRWKDVPNGAVGFWMQRMTAEYATGFDAARAREDLSALRVPTLATWGRFDPHPLGNMSFVRDAIAGCQLAMFEHSGHFPQMEETELFTSTLRAFLRGEPLPQDGGAGAEADG